MTYEDFLESNGELTYTNVGTSMMPLLKQHRDLFTVRRKGSARCRAGDVVLYRRPPNKYVLHRVVEVRKNDYVILGDNCINKEYGITDGDIIGVMTGYVRKGRTHTVKDRSYRIYKAYIMHTIPLRVLFKKVKLKTKRAVKRFL
ncbi:MAG: S24/S26 family peptidase [Ruminococcus sp.]|nr:S24/S26 family peptidase [Ruminococcus sp.]